MLPGAVRDDVGQDDKVEVDAEGDGFVAERCCLLSACAGLAVASPHGFSSRTCTPWGSDQSGTHHGYNGITVVVIVVDYHGDVYTT